MIISVRKVKKIRSIQMCPNCDRAIHGECISLYGAADTRDRPYRIWIHYDCASKKITESLIRPFEQGEK